MGAKKNGGICLALVLAVSLLPIGVVQTEGESFKAMQMRHSRVRAAFDQSAPVLKTEFTRRGLHYPPSAIFIRVFKLDKTVELWVKDGGEQYSLFREYPICAASGKLGPKRRQGDEQVPEGFYHIDRFNPASNFHLSLGIDYPNRSDRIAAGRGRPGGDIFIHGNCVSIGCVAITDEKIKEVYVLAVEAKTSGQTRIPVHIFPTRMNAEGMKRLARISEGDASLLSFWSALRPGFDFFKRHRKPPVVSVDSRGRYTVDSRD